MVGHPCAIVAIDAPDGNRWADRTSRHSAPHSVTARRLAAGTLVTKPSGYFAETHIDQLLDRLRPERLAEHRQQIPIVTPEHRVEKYGKMLPTRPGSRPTATGGKHMEWG